MFSASTRYALIVWRYLIKNYFENKYSSASETSETFNTNLCALMLTSRQVTCEDILCSRVGGKEISSDFKLLVSDKNSNQISYTFLSLKNIHSKCQTYSSGWF